MFCEAVKAGLENSKETSFKKTSSTDSFITVLFEDLFQATTLHWEFSGEKVRLEPSTSLLNKTKILQTRKFYKGIFLLEATR
jgi:hypothetical protein